MSMKEAFKLYWRRWLDFRGTSSRQEFWKAFAVWAVIIVTFIGGLNAAPSINTDRLGIVLNVLWLILMPWLPLMQRRLNDTGINPLKADIMIWCVILLPLLTSIIPPLGIIENALVLIIFILCIFPTGYFSK